MHQRLIELAIQYISGDNGGLGYKPKRMISNRFAFVSAAMDYFTELSISDVRDLVREQLTKRKSAAALVLLFLFNIIVRYPFIVFYYCYLWIPVLIIRAIVQVIIKIINIVVKKSAKARKILLHIYATIDIVENAANKIMKTRFSELMTIFSQTLIEVQSKREYSKYRNIVHLLYSDLFFLLIDNLN